MLSFLSSKSVVWNALLKEHAERVIGLAMLSTTGESTVGREFLLACLHILRFWRTLCEGVLAGSPLLSDQLITTPIIFFVLKRLSCFLEVFFNEKLTSPYMKYRRWAFLLFIELVKLALFAVHNQKSLEPIIRVILIKLRNLFQKILNNFNCALCLQTQKTDSTAEVIECSAQPSETIEIKSNGKKYLVPPVKLLPKAQVEQSLLTIQRPLSQYELGMGSIDLICALRPVILVVFSVFVGTKSDRGSLFLLWIARFAFDLKAYHAAKRIEESKPPNTVFIDSSHSSEKEPTLEVSTKQVTIDTNIQSDIIDGSGIPLIGDCSNQTENRRLALLRRNIFSAVWVEPLYSSCYLKSMIDSLFIHGGFARVPFFGRCIHEAATHFQKMCDSSKLFTL
ncbi:hypothetical protein XU18_1720 [Perkinsela sp. CCAP 1560/4]|nr:hypothetical protein XU18_1720 [Perkinsela sp. CCAP 1560/4]|eukprot:KNH07626.1 hypothetical protein XU18_1720 [Perkinsela sp. CCAP 1560/4]